MTIQLSDYHHAILQGIADKTNMSIAELVRLSVSEFVEGARSGQLTIKIDTQDIIKRAERAAEPPTDCGPQ